VADPLLRYLSYSAARLMHNLLRAFNNALPLARPPLHPRGCRGIDLPRRGALIFHECFDVCFVSIRRKGGSATIQRRLARKEEKGERGSGKGRIPGSASPSACFPPRKTRRGRSSALSTGRYRPPRTMVRDSLCYVAESPRGIKSDPRRTIVRQVFDVACE
jgi:hypothetical protein